MNYFKQVRVGVMLASFLAFALVAVNYAQIDILVSSQFYNNGFYLANAGWTTFLHDATPYFIGLSMLVTIGIYAFNKLTKRNVCQIDGKKIAYLACVLIIGAGLIVNVMLKDNFGRARPRDIEAFGGAKQFTPAFVMSSACDRNCSFSCGDCAGAFFSIALALALSRKRIALVAALALGTLVALSRVAAGAHFFSDAVTSFFVMLILAHALHYYMFLAKNRNL